MDQHFDFLLDNHKRTKVNFGINSTLLVDFTTNGEKEEYIFTFVNTKRNNSLIFTFLSDVELYCYFKYERFNGSSKIIGYKSIHENEHKIDISDVAQFSIFIPRKENEGIKSNLILTKFSTLN